MRAPTLPKYLGTTAVLWDCSVEVPGYLCTLTLKLTDVTGRLNDACMSASEGDILNQPTS